MYRYLRKYGVKTIQPSVSVPAGKIRSNGVINNLDMWRIDINRKQELWNFISQVEIYIKHQNKVDKIKEIKENLQARGLRINSPSPPLAKE